MVSRADLRAQGQPISSLESEHAVRVPDRKTFRASRPQQEKQVMLKKADSDQKEQSPEKLRYSRYYEHDGALRAYANRAMVLTMLCVPVTLISLALAAYVRLQPPTVIRVDP